MLLFLLYACYSGIQSHEHGFYSRIVQELIASLPLDGMIVALPGLLALVAFGDLKEDLCWNAQVFTEDVLDLLRPAVAFTHLLLMVG
jgi:hypothetical protein